MKRSLGQNSRVATEQTLSPLEESLTHENSSHLRLSNILLEIFDPAKKSSTFGEVVDNLDQHGMALVLILFSLPSALPIPAPGYSTILSVPLLAIALRLLRGKDTVWLPARARAMSFRPADFQKMTALMLRLVRFIERFTKPRLSFLVVGTGARMLFGLLILSLACFMAVPIPGTNTLPAGGIFLIGFGMLERDGLLSMLGVCYSIAALIIGALILVFGYEVVKQILLQFF
jgi:hypothetical protein